ncbi:MAG: hypothetical protein ABI887_03135 [Burkholderiales bacterium]
MTARAALHANIGAPAAEPVMRAPTFTCWHCGRPLLVVVEILMRGRPAIRAPPP